MVVGGNEVEKDKKKQWKERKKELHIYPRENRPLKIIINIFWTDEGLRF